MPRGGKRENSGPKKDVKVFSDRVRKNYETADKFFSNYLLGKDIKPRRITSEMVNVGFIHGLVWDRGSQRWLSAKIQDAVRVGAVKVRQEALVIRESKRTVEQHQYGPKIGLPAMQEKPKDGEFPIVNTRMS